MAISLLDIGERIRSVRGKRTGAEFGDLLGIGMCFELTLIETRRYTQISPCFSLKGHQNRQRNINNLYIIAHPATFYTVNESSTVAIQSCITIFRHSMMNQNNSNMRRFTAPTPPSIQGRCTDTHPQRRNRNLSMSSLSEYNTLSISL